MNKVILYGRLTADPELKKITDGTSVVNFNIAVHRPGTAEKTDFLPCTAWGRVAEFIFKYLKKGALLIVCGCMISEEWKDKEGRPRIRYGVRVDEVKAPRTATEGQKEKAEAVEAKEDSKEKAEDVEAKKDVEALYKEFFEEPTDLPF